MALILRRTTKKSMKLLLSGHQHSRQTVTYERAAIYNLYRHVDGSCVMEAARQITSNKIEVNGVDMHYEITGTGNNVLLLLPGALGCSRTDFKHQMEHLNKDMFTMIAWDPRGYGRSIPPERDWPEHFLQRDANDAAQLMNNLGVKKYSVLGWSDGGITALMLAASQPDNVCKLVVWGANAYITDDELKTYEGIRNIDNWGESARKHYLQVYDEKYFRHHFNAWVDAFLNLKTKRNGDICTAELKKIVCPTLVIHGERDVLVPRFHADFLVKNIKNASRLYGVAPQLCLLPGKEIVDNRWQNE